jgi:DNA-binding MarR family transcriptional regulator
MAAKAQTASADHQSTENVQRLYRSSGYDLASHPAHVIRRAHQRATMRFQEAMGSYKLTPTQFAALATILKHSEISQNQLGRLTAMDPSTVSLVIRKLSKEGLVESSGSQNDQRLTLIRLTDKGTRVTLPLLAVSVEVGRRVLAPLTPAEQALFMTLLDRVAAGTEVADGEI